MRPLYLLLSLACALLGQLCSAAEQGLCPGIGDSGPALRKLLQGVQDDIIDLKPGEYHFYADGAPVYKLFISNHDQQGEYPVALPLTGLRNVTLRGNGSRFIFHGCMLPLLVMDSSNVTLEGIDISYATPFSAEGRIVAQDEDFTTLEMHQGSQWCVENGRFFNRGEGWKDKVGVAIAFMPDGRIIPSGRSGDIIWNFRAEQLNDTHVRFSTGNRDLGLHVGNTLVLRSYWRPCPAMLLYRACDTTLREVVFHNSMGMALLAQRSENITIKGGGCIREPGRYGTAGADATHFSNCKGFVLIEGALYEGMMDDAINVHATCLGITEVISPTEIVARYMHPQAVGFEVVQPGESVQFIHGRTLENHPQPVRVKQATLRDNRTLQLTLEAPLPPGIGAGDALENAEWHPAVTFRNNTIRHNRARGTLFTTPKPVLVEHNNFVWSSGSAILLAGDAQGWYESGRCQNVTIRHNLFDHNLSSLFQFTDAVISICPEVKQPAAQRECYHRGIRIEHNRFLTHRVPLLSAVSADGLIFRNNEVFYDDDAPTLFKGEPYRIRHCGQVELQDVESP